MSNVTLANFSIKLLDTSMLNRNNHSFFNTGCIDELNKLSAMCTDFRLHVAETLNYRFEVALIVLGVLVLYQFIVRLVEPDFSFNPYYKAYVSDKIDLVIVLLLLSYLAYIFFL